MVCSASSVSISIIFNYYRQDSIAISNLNLCAPESFEFLFRRSFTAWIIAERSAVEPILRGSA
jgi:hypothetical protein